MSQMIPNLYIAETPNKGRGVFTGAAIPADSLIEICPMIILPPQDVPHLESSTLFDYYFEWGEDGNLGAIALGYGSIYNHSFQPNAFYDMDMEANVLRIYALKDIPAGSEILFNYNGDPEDLEPLWFLTA